jgi:hypothetical protein
MTSRLGINALSVMPKAHNRDPKNVNNKIMERLSHCKQDPIYVFPEMKLRGLIS